MSFPPEPAWQAGPEGVAALHRRAPSVFETTIGDGPPLHVHDREDECFYVLDGELSIRCGTDTFDAPAGSFVFLPRGRPHRFRATGQPARLLLIAVPGGIEDYFRQISAASTDQQRHQIGEQYHIRVVPDEPVLIPSATRPSSRARRSAGQRRQSGGFYC